MYISHEPVRNVLRMCLEKVCAASCSVSANVEAVEPLMWFNPVRVYAERDSFVLAISWLHLLTSELSLYIGSKNGLKRCEMVKCKFVHT
jgi:hypothetical protein